MNYLRNKKIAFLRNKKTGDGTVAVVQCIFELSVFQSVLSRCGATNECVGLRSRNQTLYIPRNQTQYIQVRHCAAGGVWRLE